MQLTSEGRSRETRGSSSLARRGRVELGERQRFGANGVGEGRPQRCWETWHGGAEAFLQA